MTGSGGSGEITTYSLVSFIVRSNKVRTVVATRPAACALLWQMSLFSLHRREYYHVFGALSVFSRHTIRRRFDLLWNN